MNNENTAPITENVIQLPVRKTSLSDVIAFIDSLEDPAMLNALKGRIVAKLPVELPSRIRPPKPWGLPAKADLTLMQVCLFDNRDKPKSKASYGLALEWWSGDPDDIELGRPDGKLSVMLYTAAEFGRVLRNNRSKSQAWIDDLKATLADEGKDRLYGPVFASAPGKGSGYVPGQLIMASAAELGGSITIWNTESGDFFEIKNWATHYHTGDELKDNAKFVSRVAFAEFRDGWATSDRSE
jgi:hypothetical protein